MGKETDKRIHALEREIKNEPDSHKRSHLQATLIEELKTAMKKQEKLIGKLKDNAIADDKSERNLSKAVDIIGYLITYIRDQYQQYNEVGEANPGMLPDWPSPEDEGAIVNAVLRTMAARGMPVPIEDP